MTEKLDIIRVTDDYGLRLEDTCYALYRLATVDPTRAPGYKAVMDDPAPEVRREWKPAYKYYTRSATGLAAAVQEIVISSVDTDKMYNIATYVNALAAEVKRITQMLESALKGGPANGGGSELGSGSGAM